MQLMTQFGELLKIMLFRRAYETLA